MIMKTIFLSLITALFTLSISAQQSVSNRTVEQQLNDTYCTGLFNSTDGSIFDVASTPGVNGYLNIIEWLDGRVSGMQTYKTRMGAVVPVLRGRVPGVYIDEIQVSPSAINMLSVHDIAMVKVIKTPFYGGFNGGNGAIAIYTKGSELIEEDEGDSK
jgi:hypothetical protein